MAKQSAFSTGGYELGWLNGQACATWWEGQGDDSKRKRHRLPAFKTDGFAACKSALISFAEGRKQEELRTDTTIEKVFKEYREYLVREGKVELPAITVWKHLGPHFGRLSPSEISDQVCQQYAKDRRAQGASIGTVWTELNRLAASLNWASKKNLIKERFGLKAGGFVVWVPSKPEGRDTVLSVEEVIRLVDACKLPHIQLFVLVTVMGGGPRHMAVLDLEWDRVNIQEGWINFKLPGKRTDVLHKGHTKGRAKVPMTKTLRTTLEEYKASRTTDYVIEFKGARVRSVKKAFAAAAIEAGLCEAKVNRNGRKVIWPTCTPHTLRHTVATWLRSGMEGFAAIAAVLGHRDSKTTELVYAHVQVDPLRPTVEKLDVFKGRPLRLIDGRKAA